MREKHWSVASCMLPTGDTAHSPAMFLDGERDQQPFGSQDSTQSTEPPQPGQFLKKIYLLIYFFKNVFIYLFLERGREGERGEKHQCVVASHAPYWVPGPQPRRVF